VDSMSVALPAAMMAQQGAQSPQSGPGERR
jgi:hypothetical protein